MANYAIITDLNRCTGCLACTVACKAINGVDVGSFWIKTLRVGPHPIEGGSGTFPDVEMYFLPVQCQHCGEPRMREGVPHGSVPHPRRRHGANRQVEVHRLPVLRDGVPVRRALPQSGRARRGEMHAIASSVSRRASSQCVAQCGSAPASSATSIGRVDNSGGGASRQPRLPVRGDDPDAREAEGTTSSQYTENDIHPSCGCGQRAEAHVPSCARAESGGSRLCILNGPLFSSPSSYAVAGGALGAQRPAERHGQGKKMQLASLVTALAALVVGGCRCSMHLQHWERIFNGFGHITSGITLEFIGCIVFAVVLVLYFLMMRCAEDGMAPKWCGVLAIIMGLALPVITGMSYLMASLPSWNTPLLPVYYLANTVFMGGLTALVIAGLTNDDSARRTWA